MIKRLKWLDRSAFTMPMYICLATSQEILNTELRRIKFNSELGVTPNAGATTNFLTNDIGETSAIVCLFDYKGLDKKQIYALLCHEAVHIFQELCSQMNEEKPSKEFEAWTIQKISQDLFYEFDRQTTSRRQDK
jgi:hypothetical protein